MSAFEPTFLAAVEAGATLYMTSKPCKRGHLSPRYVTNRGCIACSVPQRERPRNQLVTITFGGLTEDQSRRLRDFFTTTRITGALAAEQQFERELVLRRLPKPDEPHHVTDEFKRLIK